MNHLAFPLQAKAIDIPTYKWSGFLPY